MLRQIEAVLNRKVRPELAKHEGNLAVESYENGILKVRLLGRCSNCPSAQLSTETMIKARVVEALPEISDVVLVRGVSEETNALARAILTARHRE